MDFIYLGVAAACGLAIWGLALVAHCCKWQSQLHHVSHLASSWMSSMQV